MRKRLRCSAGSVLRFVLILSLIFSMTLCFTGCAKNLPQSADADSSLKEGAEKEGAENSETSPVYELQSGDNIHTIALVSDTQKYAQSDESTYMAMFKALVDDKDTYNIEYVIHTGDLVQAADKDNQWQIAKNAISQLDGIIPYGVLAGNHDQDLGDDRFTAFTKYFCESADDAKFQVNLVTIGSTDFVVVYICDDPDKATIELANKAFAANPDRIGILCTHKYLDEDLSLEEMGEYMLENIVKKNSNVYMVLCGHESAAGYLETELDDGRTVLQIMANYQDANNKGTLMYLQIDETAKTLTAISYSPVTGSYDGYKDSDTDQFRVELPW